MYRSEFELQHVNTLQSETCVCVHRQDLHVCNTDQHFLQHLWVTKSVPVNHLPRVHGPTAEHGSQASQRFHSKYFEHAHVNPLMATAHIQSMQQDLWIGRPTDAQSVWDLRNLEVRLTLCSSGHSCTDFMVSKDALSCSRSNCHQSVTAISSRK